MGEGCMGLDKAIVVSGVAIAVTKPFETTCRLGGRVALTHLNPSEYDFHVGVVKVCIRFRLLFAILPVVLMIALAVGYVVDILATGVVVVSMVMSNPDANVVGIGCGTFGYMALLCSM